MGSGFLCFLSLFLFDVHAQISETFVWQEKKRFIFLEVKHFWRKALSKPEKREEAEVGGSVHGCNLIGDALVSAQLSTNMICRMVVMIISNQQSHLQYSDVRPTDDHDNYQDHYSDFNDNKSFERMMMMTKLLMAAALMLLVGCFCQTLWKYKKNVGNFQELTIALKNALTFSSVTWYWGSNSF